MKIPTKAQRIVYRMLEAEDFADDASIENYVKGVAPNPPRALLQDVIRQKEQHHNKEFQSSAVHTNPQGETFCFGRFGSGKNSLMITLLWFNQRNGKWYDFKRDSTGEYHGMHETMSDKEIKRYLSGVKARPGLKRYSTTQLQRFLRRRQPVQPEPPGEPHRIVREALDPDDPELFLKSQPGFVFRMTSYDGEQVILRGDSDVGTDSDWPWPIGNVIQGPDHRWYVINIHRIQQERLNEYGLGFGARTFDTKEDAALAIWRVWSQLPKREVLDRKRRNRVREDIDKLLEDAVRPSANIEKELIKASKDIRHCGDYGTLYYHPGKHEVHWNMADSDGAPDYTSSDEIEKLLSLPGVTHVELGDEWSPNEAEGWKRLV